MSAALALIAEKLRRDRRSEQLREAVCQHFEVIEHRRWTPTQGAPWVRRVDVYAVAAERLGVVVPTNGFLSEVRDFCIGLGAVPTKPANQHRFAFMRVRRRSAEVGGAPVLSDADLKRLRAAWYKRAAESGFDDIERATGELRGAGSAENYTRDRYKVKATINAAVFESAQEHYWRMERELRVWEAFAIDGLSARETAEKLGIPKSTVNDIVRRIRATIGHQTDREDDDDGGEAQDDRGDHRDGHRSHR